LRRRVSKKLSSNLIIGKAAASVIPGPKMLVGRGMLLATIKEKVFDDGNACHLRVIISS